MLSLVCGKKVCKITLKVLTSCYPGSSFDKKKQIFSLNILNSATLHEILIAANEIKPTSQTYFENIF